MVKPPEGTNEKVRARVLELTGKDMGDIRIGDVFAGPRYHELTPDQIAEQLAQSIAACGVADFSSKPPESGQPKTNVRDFVSCLPK